MIHKFFKFAICIDDKIIKYYSMVNQKYCLKRKFLDDCYYTNILKAIKIIYLHNTFLRTIK